MAERISRGSGWRTSVLLGCAAGAAAATVLSTTTSLPHSACSAALGLWAAFRQWLSPPYLFAVVNIIVALLWKLTDNHHPQRPEEAPTTLSTPPPPPPMPPPVTTSSLIDAEDQKGVAFEPENDTMEETWKAIMAASASPVPSTASPPLQRSLAAPASELPPRRFRKSETFPKREVEGWRRKDFTAAEQLAAEQDRVFEAFIRATHEQIRSPRREYKEMVRAVAAS